jgi:hypothetical protein
MQASGHERGDLDDGPSWSGTQVGAHTRASIAAEDAEP